MAIGFQRRRGNKEDALQAEPFRHFRVDAFELFAHGTGLYTGNRRRKVRGRLRIHCLPHFPAKSFPGRRFFIDDSSLSSAYRGAAMNRLTLPKICYGADYNPEQWDESVWQEDMRLMRQAGVNIVSLAIFAWARVNPAPGVFTFEWLDRIMDLLAENGIAVNLATATASPPVWLEEMHPDISAVDADGLRYHHGSRQNFSPNSPDYRRYAAALVRAIATRYKDHPALVMWHINNEYACANRESHGPHDTAAFQEWLRAKYGTIEALNSAWNTAFWSQHYFKWEQIPTPRKTPTLHNPIHVLDFRRFTSDSFLECYRMEAEILREITPGIPLTTNFMGTAKVLDQFKWGEHLDVACWDSYPDPTPGTRLYPGSTIGHDLTRSIKPDRPFLLMEQVTSQVNWRPINKIKPPGVMRLWSYQALARGSDGILFFQWRQSIAGGEAFHGAMVGHVPPESSRVFHEVCDLGAELKKLEPVAGSLVNAEAAIIFSWDCFWALEYHSKPRHFSYEKVIDDYYRFFNERNIAVNLVPPSADLSRYKFVVAPQTYMLSEEEAANLRKYVRHGGHLLVTFFSGLVDEKTHFGRGGYPALLRDMLGLWVEEWQPYHDEEHNRLTFPNGRSYACGYLAESVHATEARTLAVFEQDFFAGQPAVTRNAYGKGIAYYVATHPEPEFFDYFLDGITAGAGLKTPLTVARGVEALVRENEKYRFIFLLNHCETAHVVNSPELHGVDLITQRSVAGVLELVPRGVAVVMQERKQ